MKLLIVTQVVDTQHPVLGFFHRWIEEFASTYETVIVICLEEGVHNLPSNVTVRSLGKEKKQSRLQYVQNFYRLIWAYRNEYDHIFIHMNQIYVLLGALVWKIMKKRVGLWYAHGTVSNSLRLAVSLADVVFTSTEEGLRIATTKKKIVGQGIDTKKFIPASTGAHHPLRLITVGRIAYSKNIDTLLKACAILKERKLDFHFVIVGAPITKEEKKCQAELSQLVGTLGISPSVEWRGAVANNELPALLQASDIFISDGATNSLDKALLEASLCGCVVTSSNPAYRQETEHLAPELLFAPKKSEQLADSIESVSAGSIKSNAVTNYFRERYSITQLIKNILTNY